MSVAHITKADLMVNGVAGPGGLEDPKLGTCDYHATCRTCRCTYTGSGQVNDCPGHFGHIEVRHVGTGRCARVSLAAPTAWPVTDSVW